jgi:hypothetical protein
VLLSEVVKKRGRGSVCVSGGRSRTRKCSKKSICSGERKTTREPKQTLP